MLVLALTDDTMPDTVTHDLLGLARSFGQIMLQASALTGLLFMLGIGIGSLPMLIGALVGALSGLLSARLLRYDSAAIGQGLYGFNATLVGLALFFFHAPSATLTLLAVAGGVLSTVFIHAMRLKAPSVPPLTLPFVLTTWLMLFVGSLLQLPLQLPAGVVASADAQAGYLLAVLSGVGQVMFQNSWVAGLLFLTGLALHSRRAAICAALGSASGLSLALWLGFPDASAALGIYGFNAALVAIALVPRFGINVFPTLLGILLSVWMTREFQLAIVPALTLPFVLATWLVLASARCMKWPLRLWSR